MRKGCAIKSIVFMMLLIMSSMIFLGCDKLSKDEVKDVDAITDENVGVVNIVIDERVISVPAEYRSFHDLLLSLKASGVISRYEYTMVGERVYPVAIDKYKDIEDGDLLVYHNIEDTTLYTTNNIKKIGDITYRCSIVGMNELPANIASEFLIVCE